MIIMGVLKATGDRTFKTNDADFKTIKNFYLITEMKPVKVEGL